MQAQKNSYLTLSVLKKDPNGNTIFSTRTPVSIDPHKADKFHMVTEMDNIEMISYKYYGTVDYWWALANLNGISYPMELTIGELLRIPTIKRLKVAINNARII